MGFEKTASLGNSPFIGMKSLKFSNKVIEKAHSEKQERAVTASHAVPPDVDIDMREVYFLILQLLSAGPCQRSFELLWDEGSKHDLLPRRYHAWYSRSGAHSSDDGDNGVSYPLTYNNLVDRYPHIQKDHLIKLLKQLTLNTAGSFQGSGRGNPPTAADVPTILGSDSFSLLKCDLDKENTRVKLPQSYLRWPHMQAGQLHGLALREIGGGFTKHHRSPSIRSACYAIAKPLTMVEKMQNIKKLRGHRDAVYCAILDDSGRYLITGSDDRLVKIWSMETAFCLASCRGHEGDITDLAVSSNNALVASASNDFNIRVWRLADGYPISVLRGHTKTVTAIAFSPRLSTIYHLLSSSEDGTCRIWDARCSDGTSQVYTPKPLDTVAGRNTGTSSNGVPPLINAPPTLHILCCAYNANGTVFVTGSSDNHARVWTACKLNKDESGQPVHEMDLLAGHEDDVNYVQFSGCALASKSSIIDSTKDDKFSKFKNSWFCHDNIVTCSRDGSAIIWIPRSRRSHGKVRGWTRAYHLKVPPPPLPPQPPRGGPRQRLLPSPRGVNMIVWSLDNRFVLAAIMDCRICVWNAADGSLVHSLAGHSAFTYVLDVHPFNPRIAMSAGYDGKTIVWDIWEGKPLKVYEIGRFKLVDGKFSPDGTSIVLSDDVGQIYLLSTGQGESQKDAKYDQFFLGDYRPLIRDSHGYALDQETQLVPYKRNLEDLLCDSSMIPYPEPYQTMYQKRRLGALNMEWRPSSRHFAVGNDISFGPEYQLQPLADLDRMIEPLPEFLDAIYWEPEPEVNSDDTDSEYNITEEYCSGNERVGVSGDTSSGIDCSEESGDEDDERDGLRRSRRKKQKAIIDLTSSSLRRVKRRMLNESEGAAFSGDIKPKTSRNESNSSRRKSSKTRSSRPQRAAARNARSMFSQFKETSSDEEEADGSQEDTSNSESMETEQPSLGAFKETLKPHKPLEGQGTNGNRRLVFKLSIPEFKKHPSLESTSQREENLTEKTTSLISEEAGLSKVDDVDSESYQNLSSSPQKLVDHMDICKGNREVSICTPKQASAESHAEDNISQSMNQQASAHLENKNSGVQMLTRGCTSVDVSGTCAQVDLNSVGKMKHHTNPSLESSAYWGSEVPPPKVTKFRFKLKHHPKKPTSPSDKIMKLDDQDDIDSNVEINTYYPSNYNHGKGTTDLLEYCDDTTRKTRSMVIKATGSDLLESSTDAVRKTRSMGMKAMVTDLPESSADAIRTTRSKGLKATLRQENVDSIGLKVREGRDMAGTSRNPESISMRALDVDLYEELVSTSKVPVGLRSSRNTGYMHHKNDPSLRARKKFSHQVRKLSWLMLTEHEESCRYIPQLGDTVVYFKQGHEEYLKTKDEVLKYPWTSVKNAIEIFTVERLHYAQLPGSGESCCKLKLKCSDPSSSVYGKQFDLTLSECIDAEFVVEKTRYDDSIARIWSPEEKCQVWWRGGIEDEEGGKWWEGTVVFWDAKSPNFPDSPWEIYDIQYEDSSYKHSPWELHDSNDPWLHPHMESEITKKLISLLTRLEQSDKYGIQTLNMAAEKLDYLNRFPVPLYPEIIRLRLENNYYRCIKAVEHDMHIMLSNAESYYPKHPDLLAKFRRASERFEKTLSKLNVDL